MPFNLAVDKESIYWSDLSYRSIWKINKNTIEGESLTPMRIQNFTSKPQGILYKTDYLSSLSANEQCKGSIDKVINQLRTFNDDIGTVSKVVDNQTAVVCLNKGIFNKNTGKCVCSSPEYKGDLCEESVCTNYCLNGLCSYSSNGPKCKCTSGFSGQRCEINLCQNFCLNDGQCTLNNGTPECDCTHTHYEGSHCENIKHADQICKNFCLSGTIPIYFTKNMTELCGECTDDQTLDCMNNGDFDKKTRSCDCPTGYTGELCEKYVCDNYCLQGACHVTSTGYPQCTCSNGFSGERCEETLCHGFCLNKGTCQLEYHEPVCHCTPMFTGRHCEKEMDTNEICSDYCKTGVYDIERHDIVSVIETCDCNNTKIIESYQSKHTSVDDERSSMSPCKAMTTTALIISGGVIVSLAIFLGILIVIKRMSQKFRPKIKKTYVVRKNVQQLTCRPATTEQQCEIVIEDCCNMNYCETVS